MIFLFCSFPNQIIKRYCCKQKFAFVLYQVFLLLQVVRNAGNVAHVSITKNGTFHQGWQKKDGPTKKPEKGS